MRIEVGREQPDDEVPKWLYWMMAGGICFSLLVVGVFFWWVYREPEMTPERLAACETYRAAEDDRWDAKGAFGNGSMTQETFIVVADRSSVALKAVRATGIDWKDCPQF